MARNIATVLGVCLAMLPLAASAQETVSGRGFNPKISLILQGTYADYSARSGPEVPGVLLGPDTGFRAEGASLAESELVFEANVDDQFHGWATVALENEDGETIVALEEAYIDTLALPGGMALKAGRFFSEIGYLNRLHVHAWDFVDAPVVYRALLANKLGEDGLQLRWVAPLDLFVELGAEALRGQSFPAGGDPRDGINTITAFSHVGGDVGAGGSWRMGYSRLDFDASNRETGDNVRVLFTGDSVMDVVDVVFKWAPHGNFKDTYITATAEFFRRDEDGTVVFDPGGSADTSAYDGTQTGFYAQLVWQFLPRWRVGARVDRLKSDNFVANPAPGTALENLANDAIAPQRQSLMLDYSRSEFSRLRLQINHDETRPGGAADNQVFLQYVMSLGAHPAHVY